MSRATAHLIAADAVFGPIIKRAGPFKLVRREAEPYAALIKAVAGQQLHARAADAIMARFLALYSGGVFPAPEQVLATDEVALRGCGFSAAKIAAVRDIAAQRLSGVVPGAAEAAGLDDAALIERLTRLRGVGRWTVEMLLIFTLGRPDVLPVDDFAVREGWRLLNGAALQLKARALAELGERWAPFRTTAAWYLWRAADEGKRPGLRACGCGSGRTASHCASV